MKPVLIFRHIECEGPGFLADILNEFAVPYDIIAIDKNQSIPPSIAEVSGLVFMGGPMSVNDPLPWIDQECHLIRQAVSENIPVLGHCLGGQLISKALGGQVRPNPVKEIGWLPVRRIAGEVASDWLADIDTEFVAFHWHGETFSIPAGSTPILESDFCSHQGFVAGNTLALQCHIEMTAAMVTEWADLYGDELKQPSASIQSAQEMVLNLEARAGALHQVARVLYQRWLLGLVRD